MTSAHSPQAWKLARATSIILLAAVLLSGCSFPLSQPTAPSAGASSPPLAASFRFPTPEPSENLALGRPATASNALPDRPAAAVVDGDIDTTWTAGAHPPQWIEIDLGAPFDLDRLILTVAQDPAGATVHQIWGRGENGDYRLLHEFRDGTADGQDLDVSPIAAWTNIRYVKVQTTESPSWVAWREIAVFGWPAEAQAGFPGSALSLAAP